MSKRGAAAAVAALVLVLFRGMAGWSESRAQEAKMPPTDLKLVGDHWTAWDPPAPRPQRLHLIQKGDTLWDLAEAWLGDPYLWPQIWDENRYVLDSHWIYPGDPLVRPRAAHGRASRTAIPPVAQVDPMEPVDTGDTGRTGRRQDGEQTGQGQDSVAVTRWSPWSRSCVPVADATDLYCSGYIEHTHVPADDVDRRGEIEREVHGRRRRDLSQPRSRTQGLRAGDELTILRRSEEVKHPDTGRNLGLFVRRLGKVRVMMAHETIPPPR